MALFCLPVKITTLTPVIFSELSGDGVMTGSGDFILGTALRGVLAHEYTKQHNLREDAQLNKEFYQLFLSGNLSFGSAYPVGKQGQTSTPVSLTYMANKDKNKGVDMLRADFEANKHVGYKPLKGFGVMDGNGLLIVGVRKNIDMHMSRQSEEERIIGSSKDGKIYNYEALEPGQVFSADIIGSKENLLLLADGIHQDVNGVTVYFGRSKHTQYGKCNLVMGKIMECPKNDFIPGQDLYIKLIADYIPANECFATVDEAWNPVVEELTKLTGEKVDFDEKKIFAAVNKQNAFVGIWGVRRCETRCIAAGSVLKLHKDSNWTADELLKVQEMGYVGVGLRCIEGFGRFVLVQPVDELAIIKADRKKNVPKPTDYSAEVKNVLEKIILQRITERLQNIAANDRKARIKQDGYKHLFARIEDIIMGGKPGKVKDAVKNEIRAHSRAEKNLDALRMDGVSLKEILYGDKPAPYEAKWEKEVVEGLKALADTVGCKLPDKNSEAVYKIYWQWYCRLARKTVPGKDGDDK